MTGVQTCALPIYSPIFLSVSSIPFPARIRKPYLCKQTKGLSMLKLKRNDLLIGFTISVLLSIFVNFALLMRKYEFETGNPSMGIQPPDHTMYYLLIWFFVFSFILFIVNSLMYKFGDKLFRRKEYKRVLDRKSTRLNSSHPSSSRMPSSA